jgi:hypothetical protein
MTERTKMTQELVEVEEVVSPKESPTIRDIETIEQQAHNFARVMAVALNMTNSRDWSDFGGNPFLESSGAEKIARPFGISFGPVTDIKREDGEDKNGKYVVFTAHYFAQWGNDRVEYIGRSSSRSKFYSQGGKLDIEEISIPNLMGHAQSNAIGNCIKRLLGLRNLTWQELEKYGIKPGKRVTFKDTSTAAASTAGARKAQKAASDKKSPIWESDYKGKHYLYARVGGPFDAKFLESMGMKKGKAEGVYYTTEDTEGVRTELEKMIEFQTSL